MLSLEKTRLENLEEQLREELGRELTPKEKFYLAISESCASYQPHGAHEENLEAA